MIHTNKPPLFVWFQCQYTPPESLGLEDCLFCGSGTAKLLDPDHITNCTEYKKMKDSVGEEVTGSVKRPIILTCIDDENSPPGPPQMLRVTPNQGGRLPFPYRDSKKAKTTNDVLAELDTNLPRRDDTRLPMRKPASIWACLACGNDSCGFESGVTIMKSEDGQDHEYDPCSLVPSHYYHEHGLKEGPVFDCVKKYGEILIECMMRSNGFWSYVKYIGSPSCDLKLRKYIALRVMGQGLLQQLWPPMRHAVKEILRYKRQMAISQMEQAYLGTYPTQITRP